LNKKSAEDKAQPHDQNGAPEVGDNGGNDRRKTGRKSHFFGDHVQLVNGKGNWSSSVGRNE